MGSGARSTERTTSLNETPRTAIRDSTRASSGRFRTRNSPLRESRSCSPTAPARALDADSGNITLSLRVPSADKASAVFEALADGGTIFVPFSDAPWSGQFGHVRDAFQIDWFVLA